MKKRLFLPLTLLALSAAILAGCGSRTPDVRWSPGLDKGTSIVYTAESFLGTPYRYGGEDPSGFDCSGLTLFVYSRNGIRLPRTVVDQMHTGRAVRKRNLALGDLVFFRVSSKGAYHVGIYAGDQQFIHAPRTGKRVEYQSMNNPYYRRRYYTARRLL